MRTDLLSEDPNFASQPFDNPAVPDILGTKDTSGLLQAGANESPGFTVPTVNPSAPSSGDGYTYIDNGRGGKMIDWTKSSTGFDPFGNPSTEMGINPARQPATSSSGWQPPAYSGNPQSYVQSIISGLGLKGAQTDPTALNTIASYLQKAGVNAGLDTRTDQYHKGLMINGQFVKMLDGNDNWIWQTGSGSGSGYDAAGSSQIFNDPATALFEQIAKLRLDQLAQPMPNPQLDQFLKDATAQMEQLRAPIYSQAEEAALRTKVFDQMERDRQTAIQQTVEHLAALGHGKESGTIPAAIDLVNRRFDQLRAQQENNLTTGAIQERQRRLQEALGISSQAAAATTAANSTQDARGREAVTTAAMFPDLADTRLQLANQSLGNQTGAISSLSNTITTLQNLNRQGKLDTASFLEQLMKAIYSSGIIPGGAPV